MVFSLISFIQNYNLWKISRNINWKEFKKLEKNTIMNKQKVIMSYVIDIYNWYRIELLQVLS